MTLGQLLQTSIPKTVSFPAPLLCFFGPFYLGWMMHLPPLQSGDVRKSQVCGGTNKVPQPKACSNGVHLADGTKQSPLTDQRTGVSGLWGQEVLSQLPCGAGLSSASAIWQDIVSSSMGEFTELPNGSF